MSQSDYLVTMRADAPFAAKGTSFDQICTKCGHRVMLAPSGQRFQKDHPAIAIICTECFLAAKAAAPQDFVDMGIAASGEEFYDELQSAQSNPRSSQN